MKLLAVCILLVLVVPCMAQSVSTGPKTVTATSSTITYTVLDTNLVIARGIARSGLRYTQAQLDSAKATVSGCTPADSARFVRMGMNARPVYMEFYTGADSTFRFTRP